MAAFGMCKKPVITTINFKKQSSIVPSSDFCLSLYNLSNDLEIGKYKPSYQELEFVI